MQKKINILFLVHKFDIGGIQKANISMLNGIDKDKFKVHVLYIEDGVLKQDVDSKIELEKIGERLELKSLRNIKYIIKVVRYIKQHNIDIVHTMDQVFYIVGATAAHITRIKHIRTQPNFIRRHERLNTKTLKILPFERWTNEFVTFNNASQKDLNLAGVNINKIHTIYGYYPLEKYAEIGIQTNIREELNVDENIKIVLTMHRLVEKKGLETFVDMVPHVVKKYKDVIFLIVGDGPLKETLIKMTKEHGVTEYVRFTGFRTDIENITNQITMGVYPLADTAGMGTVIRGGKVLISRKGSAMEEYIIDNETGYLINSDDPEDYAEHVLKLLFNDKLLKEMESKTKMMCLNMFDGNKNMRLFEELVIRTVSKKR